MNDTTAPNAVPLYRPVNGRYLTGTALGIAQKLDLPPWVIRTAFAALIFTGVGIPLYLISWLLIPGEGESEAIGERLLRDLSGSRAWVGIALVVVAGAILASSLPFFDGGVIIPTALLVLGVILFRGNYNNRPAGPPTPAPTNPRAGESRPVIPPAPRTPPPPPSMLGRLTVGFTVLSLGVLAIIDRASPLVDARPRHYLALAVTVIGLGVIVGTFYGRARWLIPFGLLLVPASIGAGFTEFADEARVQVIRPATSTELNSLYEVPVGDLTIDLREMVFGDEPVELAVEMGVGSIDVLLPPDVGIHVITEVGIGAAHVDGVGQGGFGVELDREVEGSRGVVIANLELGIGEIEVTTAVSTDQILTPRTDDEFGEGIEATGDQRVVLDLSGLTLDSDEFSTISTEDGSVSIVLPADVAYEITATSDSGEINLLGRVLSDGGEVNTSSSGNGGPVLTLEVETESGDILITQGERS